MVRRFGLLTILLSLSAGAAEPIIDVHVHAYKHTRQGPPPLAMCTPVEMPVWDPGEPYAPTFLRALKEPACSDPVWSPMSDQELMRRTLDVMDKYNVYGVLSGSREMVRKWAATAPGRFFNGMEFSLSDSTPSPEQLAEWHAAGELEVLAEITTQYQGIAPTDPRLEPYWAVLEEHDIPAGIHIGPGPPGVIYLGSTEYRARDHSALTIEEVLVAHPGLRVYVMHAGFPLLDDMLAVLYAHPQVYVGTGVIVYTQPREIFYRYLQALVDAGFGKRILFGSDQMVWPETMERAIQTISEAPFLSKEQKRDILFNNAARFLRLTEAEITRMRAGDPAPD